MVRVLAVLITLCVAASASAQERLDRPGLLIPLYAVNATLHGLDIHSTMRSLEAGNREANPLMSGMSTKTMIGVKVAASATSIWASEKLWKRNRWTAVGVMVATNALLSAAVAQNYRITRRARPAP